MTATAVTSASTSEARFLGLLQRLRWRHVPTAITLIFLLAIAVCAIAPSLIAPYNPLNQNLFNTNARPFGSSGGGYHLFGTDELGRDVFSRLVYGARVSLGIAVAAVVGSSALGIPLGIVAGYRGGRLDTLIMRLVDGILSFPLLVSAIFFLYIAGGGTWNLILVLIVFRWVVYCRVTRALTLPYRSSGFVESAKSIGCGDLRIMFRHILPNILSPLLVLATLEMAVMILAEASLSFVGVGVQPPSPSWGVMISEGQPYLLVAWWQVTFPGLVILVTTLSLNIAAMRLREASAQGKLRFGGARSRRIAY